MKRLLLVAAISLLIGCWPLGPTPGPFPPHSQTVTKVQAPSLRMTRWYFAMSYVVDKENGVQVFSVIGPYRSERHCQQIRTRLAEDAEWISDCYEKSET